MGSTATAHHASCGWAQAGLQTVLKDKDGVFHCHNPHKMDAGGHSAQRASLAVLQAGFNMDTLMLRYQGARALGSTPMGCTQAAP